MLTSEPVSLRVCKFSTGERIQGLRRPSAAHFVSSVDFVTAVTSKFLQPVFASIEEDNLTADSHLQPLSGEVIIMTLCSANTECNSRLDKLQLTNAFLGWSI